MYIAWSKKHSHYVLLDIMAHIPSVATIAEYFRLGIQTGLIQPENAIAWADSEIAVAAPPADGIIEVAWSRSPASTMEALLAVPGERDKQLAGRLLLGLLGKSDLNSEDALEAAAKRALYIARDAELGDETYAQFNAIDDLISLASTKTYGTFEQCKSELTSTLLHIAQGVQFPPI
ncbi:hypothetical protein [Comamonas odontotermitis]|uniref:hypothetical protein n=1 Tax=Comamonas odontotermitis TaxID=379895 RepID=UPI00375015EC